MATRLCFAEAQTFFADVAQEKQFLLRAVAPTRKMMDDGGRRRGQHTERQRREHLVIPRTPTANNVDAVLSSADSDSAFFRSAANGAPYSPSIYSPHYDCK